MLDPATVDLAPALRDIAMSVASGAVTWFAGWLALHLRSERARTVVLGAVENALSYGLKRTPGLRAGDTLPVPVASTLAATMLRYMLAQVPGQAKRLGLDAHGLARLVIAKMPAVEGHLSDETVNGIVAVATGQAPPPVDYGELAGVIASIVKQAGEAAIAATYQGAPVKAV